MENWERVTNKMKKTSLHKTLLAFGIVAVALLSSGQLTPARAAVAKPTLKVKTASLPITILLAGGGDGQESNGGKTHG